MAKDKDKKEDKNKPKSFILNDETKTNSYGFRVKNAGINLERFNRNPVLLDCHYTSNQSVVGRWENIRIEGHLLLADPLFDEEDENAVKIKGKVERGFIKGASMGLAIASEDAFEKVDGIPVLTESELTEASIVPIPSNANALKLYKDNGVEMDAPTIKLSIESIINKVQTKTNSMKKLQLSPATMVLLDLQDAQLENEVTLGAAIEKLANDYEKKQVALTAITTERDDLQAKLTAIADAKATALVEDAVKTGKITADRKDYFLKLAKQDFDTCNGILEGIPTAKNLSGQAKNNGGAKAFDEVKTMDDFEKLSFEDKLALKEDYPEKYKQIMNV